MKCPDTMALVSQIKTTLDPDKKSEMIQTIKLRICGEPSDRSVCCTVDQSKVLEDFILHKVHFSSQNTFP